MDHLDPTPYHRKGEVGRRVRGRASDKVHGVAVVVVRIAGEILSRKKQRRIEGWNRQYKWRRSAKSDRGLNHHLQNQSQLASMMKI